MIAFTDSFKTYLFSYEHAGASWVLEIKAASPKDAQERVRRLHTATYDGELVAKVSVPSFTLGGLFLWLRRLIPRR